VDFIRPADLERKLTAARAARRPLRVKLGFDPTAPDIHLGHVVVLRKLRDFQEAGHEVCFVVGDFTARIGDPTGRSKTRPPLEADEIRANAATYTEQAFRVLDPKATRILFNGEWLDRLDSAAWIGLAAKYSVARMLERRDFRQRFDAGQPISLHEFLYPLAQAYDSVHLEADVELGGTDQLFNLNVGRDIMPGYGLEPQVVMTTPLLEGLDGVEKMSKSLGNFVGITEAPLSMFGKLMSLSDELMWRYGLLLTGLAEREITALRGEVAAGTRHPMDVKKDFARRIIAPFHSAAAAETAAQEWQRIFSERETPEEIPEWRAPLSAEPLWLTRTLVEAGLAKTTSEVLRAVRGGGLELDGVRLSESDLKLDASKPSTRLVKLGKRRYLRLVIG
jgi:tyrosyl-tRNA synthetase